jgi:hypothetical protein
MCRPEVSRSALVDNAGWRAVIDESLYLRMRTQPPIRSAIPRRRGRSIGRWVRPSHPKWPWASTGQCDIGLVRPRSGYAGVECEPFLRVDAVCALPRQHALARKRTIAVSDLVGVPLIAGGPGVFQQAIEETFARAGIAPRFALMAQCTAARCALVAEGLGLAIVDPLPARELAGLPVVLRPFSLACPLRRCLSARAADRLGTSQQVS